MANNKDDIVLYYDPTEPCRAVSWLLCEIQALSEAENFQKKARLQLTWLGKGDHVSPSFVSINPMHQVPTLTHGSFCLTESMAMMTYLCDVYGNWHQCTLRKSVLLDYFLPRVITPYYHATPPPPLETLSSLRSKMVFHLDLLNNHLSTSKFLCGDGITLADMYIAVDLFALDSDPDKHDVLSKFSCVEGWLERLKEESEGCKKSHAFWFRVAPIFCEVVKKVENERKEKAEKGEGGEVKADLKWMGEYEDIALCLKSNN